MAALYAVYAFCRNVPATEKSLPRSSGLSPENTPPRANHLLATIRWRAR
jgi:hypothetical protein